MSKRAAIVIVALLAILVFLVGRPQYLQWRDDRAAKQAELRHSEEQAAARATAIRDCPVVAKEWEAYKQLRQPSTTLTKTWPEADQRVLDCISAGHLKREDIAGYYGN